MTAQDELQKNLSDAGGTHPLEPLRMGPNIKETISLKEAETAKWLALMIVGLFVTAVLLSLLVESIFNLQLSIFNPFT